MLSIYKASAGSGKTYTLTREYIRMMLSDSIRYSDPRSYSHILAVTFTKKATAEMKQRILTELSILADGKQSDHLNYLLHDCRLNISEKELRQRAKQLLYAILQDYSRFSVSTIDSFFQQVVRSFAIDLGLPGTYEISLDGEEIIEQAVDDLFIRIKQAQDQTDVTEWIAAFSQDNIANNRNWNPHNTITTVSKQLLKERLMRRMDALREFFADKQQLKNYRDTLNTIIRTREEQVANICLQARHYIDGREGISAFVVNTFHKTPEQLLKEGLGKQFPDLPNKPESFYVKTKVKNKADQNELMTLYHEKIEPLVQPLIDLCAHPQDYITAKLILQNLFSIGVLQDVSTLVQTTNRQLGRYPSADINLFIHQVIDGQEAPFIYERYGQYLHHYMMDEFQDTSTLQWDNFAPLLHESEANNHDNLIVGDVKQSIYRWRNSDWELLEKIPALFSQKKEPLMTDNWRTSPLIVQHNTELFARYRDWVVSKLQEEVPDEAEHIADSIQSVYDTSRVEQNAHRNLPGVFHMQFIPADNSNENYLDFLPPLLEQLKNDGFRPCQTAFLVRSGANAQELSCYLISKGYAVQSADGLLIASHPAVQLLISILTLPYEPDNQILQTQIQSFSPFDNTQTQAIISHAAQLPLYEQVQELIIALKLNEKEDASAYLTALQDQLYIFCQNHIPDIPTFLTWWKRRSEKLTVPASQEENAYPILTIHKSKGLEFDTVILPWLDWEVGMRSKTDEPLWCHTDVEPFNQPDLMGIPIVKAMLQSHFRKDYIHEMVSQYMDNMNVTYVAFTRPKYRLYAFGEDKPASKTMSVGKMLKNLYQTEMDENQIVHFQSEGDLKPQSKNPDASKDNSRTSVYRYQPIAGRLTLKSRSEDDFDSSAELSTKDLGILMHDLLSRLDTFAEAETQLQRMLTAGTITPPQAEQMRLQWQQLQQLLTQTQHSDWFDGHYHTLTERDILIPQGTAQRPDRVMINGEKAIVIDYKFGNEHRLQYHQQVRDYMTLLMRMGYQPQGWIVYVALNKIEQVA